jgi:hypothetical protein
MLDAYRVKIRRRHMSSVVDYWLPYLIGANSSGHCQQLLADKGYLVVTVEYVTVEYAAL